MAQTTLAIVRYTSSDLPIRSGQLVLTSKAITRNRDPERRFVCVPEGFPDLVVRVPAGMLLPMTKFLERHPVLDFYALIHRQRMTSGQPCFLQVPCSITLGVTPYRFESEGECLYYMKLYELSTQAFLVARVSDLRSITRLKCDGKET